MTKKSSGTMEKSRESKPKLRCPDCGNSDYFIEIMDFESHLVTGHLNYVRLLDAVTDYYLCHECGRRIEPRWLRQQKNFRRDWGFEARK